MPVSLMTGKPIPGDPVCACTYEPPEPPIVKLIGEDGNVFNLIGLASKALKRAGQPEPAAELTKRAFASGSYDEVLNLIQEYCEVE